MVRGSLGKFIIIAVLIALAGIFAGKPLLGKINFGLDLMGGVHVVAQAQEKDGKPVDSDSMKQLAAVMRQRVDQLGVSEPVIQQEGSDRLIIELAGVDDPDEAVKLIGKTAMLEFKTSDGTVILSGSDLKTATAGLDSQTNQPRVSLEFNSEGAQKFAEATQGLVQKYPYGDPRRAIGVYLDNELVTNPQVREAITDGKGEISGGYANLEEAAQIAALLRGGALPVNVEIIEKRSVGPTLGQDSLDNSEKAVLVALIAIGLFMLLIYRLPGVVAVLSLVVYSLLLLLFLWGVNATLTLPGIAGMLLSLAMAVDGNIIIYERIKDELRGGKTLRAAMESGFRRAFWTIFDSNITTVLAGIVLYYLGTGPIKGFAVTLILGIVASFFSAVFLTRLLLRLLVRVDSLSNTGFYGVPARAASARGE